MAEQRVFGTGINPNGVLVTLVECSACGAMHARGASGHETPPEAASTERHKAALA